MKLIPLHNPEQGTLRAVALMSGSGTNLCRVLEHEKRLQQTRGRLPYHICAIFSDTWDSKAAAIGREYNLPVIIRDIKAFYNAHNTPRSDTALREVYDRETVALLAPLEAAFAVYAGYMSIASPVLVAAFTGINVHPADLSITEDGKRKWVGAHPVRDAIQAGETYLRASTHLVELTVDCGSLLMLSPRMEVQLPPGADLTDKAQLAEITALNQNRLKAQGDWVILPRTIECIADGRFCRDETGRLYFDGIPVPHGFESAINHKQE